MATPSKTLFEQFLAPIFSHLIDRDALVRLRDSIDWEAGVAEFTNPQVIYPNYYKTSNFHGVKNGYLSTDAALTYDPITQYVLPPGETWVRESLVKAIQGVPRRILDLGCGTGTTTQMLKRRFPGAEVMGLDLSPQMLVMADHKARAAAVEVTFRHGNAMATGLPAAAFDVVCATLLFHETPPAVAKTILAEAFRLLTPGGQLLVLDGNQRTLRATDWRYKFRRVVSRSRAFRLPNSCWLARVLAGWLTVRAAAAAGLSNHWAQVQACQSLRAEGSTWR